MSEDNENYNMVLLNSRRSEGFLCKLTPDSDSKCIFFIKATYTLEQTIARFAAVN